MTNATALRTSPASTVGPRASGTTARSSRVSFGSVRISARPRARGGLEMLSAWPSSKRRGPAARRRASPASHVSCPLIHQPATNPGPVVLVPDRVHFTQDRPLLRCHVHMDDGGLVPNILDLGTKAGLRANQLSQ